MNVKEFEYIAEIATQESISKAAARLYLSQPTLTKFLKKVEGEFGTPLFYRVGKKMIPTPAGQVCAEKARDIIALNEQMNKNIQAIEDHSRGSVRIGTSAGRGAFFIDRVLGDMTRHYPRACFTLSLGAKTDMLEKLENDELDIVFASNSSERPYLRYHNIAREEMVLVVPDGHPLLKKAIPREGYTYPYAALDDWIGYPFIMADIHMNTGQYVRLLFEHYERTPNTVLEIASLQYIYSAVLRGIGITIAPSMPMSGSEHERLRYLSFDDDRGIQWHFTAITRSQIIPSGAMEELIRLTETAYSQPS